MSSGAKLHHRNQHRNGYDFARLVARTPELGGYVIPNPSGQPTIDFRDAGAVRMLNRALLRAHYDIDFWEIPAGYLCPPIPGRVDYIHYLADLLAEHNNNEIPRGPQIRALDIGTGASLIYPIAGQSEYGWQFTGAEIDAGAIASAQRINQRNGRAIDLRRQSDPRHIFRGIIRPDDFFHVTLCNPPFHASADQARKGTQRKWAGLGKGRSAARNFGGQKTELSYPGGEIRFLARMVEESTMFAEQCLWFTSLVSKKDNLQPLSRILRKANVAASRIVDMAQGQKTSRFVAWTFMKAKLRRVSSGISET